MRGMKIVGAAIALSIMAAACSGDNEGADGTMAAPETSEGTEESTTTEPEAIPEIADATRPTLVIPEPESYNNPVEEVLDRYTLYRQARYIAAGPPAADPDYEPLEGLVIGGPAEQTRKFLKEFRDDGLVQIVEDEDAVTISPEVLTATFARDEGSTVLIQDCIVDDSYVQDRITGEVLDKGVRTIQVTTELIYEDGQWRVHEEETNHKYEGEVSVCPERR